MSICKRDFRAVAGIAMEMLDLMADVDRVGLDNKTMLTILADDFANNLLRFELGHDFGEDVIEARC